MIRELLRRRLPRRQYKTLAWFKNKTLPNVWYRMGQSPFLLMGSVLKVFPANSQVSLKAGINIVKKMDYPRHDIFLNIDSDLEYKVRLHSCKKEPETVEWVEKYLKDGDVLYDVGANVGAYSLVASKYFGGKVRVFAFEPAFLNFGQLCRNLATNKCLETVTPFQIALSDETNVENINLRALTPGSAINALGEAVDHEGDAFIPAAVQPVLSYRTDDFVSQFHIPPPTHIKIDVDGTEHSIIKGMDHILSQNSVRSILLEITEGQGKGPEIIEYLASKGFTVEAKYGLNHIFVREEQGV